MIRVFGRAVFAMMVIVAAFCGTVSVKAGNNNHCEYWIAPSPYGDDTNPGTSDMPWATLKHASDNVPDEHCTVWFRPGVYTGGNRINRRFETLTLFKSEIPYQAILENDGAAVLISGGKNITLEGFNFHHSGPGASALLIAIDQSKEGWAEKITLRNNIIHDSYNDDLLKIYDGCKDILIENNIFFNQGDSEEHMDVNSVTDVTIQDNIFFNSYESSGRENKNLSKQYIVIKDSNGPDDGLIGSQRIHVRRNILLNWEGQEKETFIQVGLDGKPYFEADEVYIENNLIIGNSNHQIGAAFGVRGAKDVFFVNNTVVGDLPAQSYAFRVTIADRNPRNENIYFVNNIWSDPTGTMGADLKGGGNEFSDGDYRDTENLFLMNNLYWNGGVQIPKGDLISPLERDFMSLVQDPLLETNFDDLVLPIWNGSEFISGSKTIREEFFRLVNLYGRPSQFSPAVDEASRWFAPEDDILDHFRSEFPDMGAFELAEPNRQPIKKMTDSIR
jgi:hypothetical protein